MGVIYKEINYEVTMHYTAVVMLPLPIDTAKNGKWAGWCGSSHVSDDCISIEHWAKQLNGGLESLCFYK